MPDSDEVKANVKSTARRAERRAKRAGAAAQRELTMPGFSPAVVGFFRGLILAAAAGALNFAIAHLGGMTEGDSFGIGLVSTALIGALRTVEGLLDVKLGAPRQTRRLGGSPVGR